MKKNSSIIRTVKRTTSTVTLQRKKKLASEKSIGGEGFDPAHSSTRVTLSFPDFPNLPDLFVELSNSSSCQSLYQLAFHTVKLQLPEPLHIAYALYNQHTALWLPDDHLPFLSLHFPPNARLEYRLKTEEMLQRDLGNVPIKYPLFVRIQSKYLSPSQFLELVSLTSSVEYLLRAIFDRFKIAEEDHPQYYLTYHSSPLPSSILFSSLSLSQFGQLELKKKSMFKIELDDPAYDYYQTLTMNEDVMTEEAVQHMIDWLVIEGVNSEMMGVRNIFPSLCSIMDSPIIPWVPSDSKLRYWEIKKDDQMLLSTFPHISPSISYTIRFRSVPELALPSQAEGLSNHSSPKRVVLLGGEVILHYFEAICKQLITPDEFSGIGTLKITNYRVFLSLLSSDRADEGGNVVYQTPLGSIQRIERVGKDKIEIHTKDYRIGRFQCTKPDQPQQIIDIIHQRCYPSEGIAQLQTFAFRYSERFLNGEHEGWRIYDPIQDFKRMGVPNQNWRLSSINELYAKAPSYPRYLCVPEKISDSQLDEVFEFRSKGRIPSISYLHRNGAVIVRSSQPQVGIASKKSNMDKHLIDLIRLNSPNPNLFYLFDCRPRANAIANRAMDGGYEMNYSNCKLKFLNIENIHVMRNSMKELIQTYNEESAPYMPGLIACKWLEHIALIIKGAIKVAKALRYGHSCLIHCSDGWDRTPQVSALAQIMLSRYYRTIEGFEVLIEREWCSYGHKFAQRVGHADGNAGDSERSPVFVQFIDSVWQLWKQFPSEFEFNEDYLLCVLYHCTSCRFGTFLFNCERERRLHKLSQRTLSLWSFIHSNRLCFSNPHYRPIYGEELDPSPSERQLEVWKELYYFHYPLSSSLSRHLLHDQLLRFQYANSQLQLRISKLETLSAHLAHHHHSDKREERAGEDNVGGGESEEQLPSVPRYRSETLFTSPALGRGEDDHNNDLSYNCSGEASELSDLSSLLVNMDTSYDDGDDVDDDVDGNIGDDDPSHPLLPRYPPLDPPLTNENFTSNRFPSSPRSPRDKHPAPSLSSRLSAGAGTAQLRSPRPPRPPRKKIVQSVSLFDEDDDRELL